MGWEKHEIEELADELDIDGGDSWSQQDRLRNISEQVGMDHFDGLSNSDADTLKEILKERKAQKQREKQREIDNNAENLRAAASILKDKGIPYASAIAAGVDAADKISGGRSTQELGKQLRTINKISGATPGGAGKKLQRSSNRLAESGLTDKINKIDSIRSGMKSGDAGDAASKMASNKSSKSPTSGTTGDTKVKGKVEIQLPLQAKLILVVIIAAVSLIALGIFVLFGAELDSAGGAGGSTYGQKCTKITVKNTGCDDSGNNCTLVYDGNVKEDDYIAGVVAAEAGNVNNLEYYKVMAIKARTYLYENAKSDCTVNGNTKFQNYIDVKDSPNSSLIKQAVKETNNLVVIEKNNLVNTYSSPACVVKEDANNYHIRYGAKTLETVQFQKIPKTWDTTNTLYPGDLAKYYSKTDKSNTDYNSKDCPDNNDYGMSQIGAYYLITQLNYSYKDVITYYYGKDSQIVENGMSLVGVDGFINPTGKLICSSPFGPRIHPVSGKESTHTGLDIAISGGEPIYAAKDGKVISVVKNVSAINNCDYGYGNYILIEHEDGISTLYAHIMYETIPDKITPGAKIYQGEVIGSVGSTGCSTGNHLHYEVRENGTRVDPTIYLNLSEATGTCKR